MQPIPAKIFSIKNVAIKSPHFCLPNLWTQ